MSEEQAHKPRKERIKLSDAEVQEIMDDLFEFFDLPSDHEESVRNGFLDKTRPSEQDELQATLFSSYASTTRGSVRAGRLRVDHDNNRVVFVFWQPIIIGSGSGKEEITECYLDFSTIKAGSLIKAQDSRNKSDAEIGKLLTAKTWNLPILAIDCMMAKDFNRLGAITGFLARA